MSASIHDFPTRAGVDVYRVVLPTPGDAARDRHTRALIDHITAWAKRFDSRVTLRVSGPKPDLDAIVSAIRSSTLGALNVQIEKTQGPMLSINVVVWHRAAKARANQPDIA